MKNSAALFVFPIILLFVVCSCSNNKPSENSEKQTSSDSIKKEIGELPARHFEGSINNKYKISMTLKQEGNKLGGVYFYLNHKIDLRLEGETDAAGNFSLNEFNPKNEKTGSFKGQITGDKISGEWKNKDGSKTFPFALEESKSEEPINDSVEIIHSKKEILTQLKGEHKLNSIGGAVGANGMFDYYIENGKWKGSGSGIENGMREGWDLKIEPAEKKFLNNLKITVHEDLGVTLEDGDKIFYSIPFSESGMQYQLKKSPKDFISNVPHTLKSSSIIEEKALFLLAKDEIPAEELKTLSILDIFADAVIIKYDFNDKQFELILFESQCCNTAIYSFK